MATIVMTATETSPSKVKKRKDRPSLDGFEPSRKKSKHDTASIASNASSKSSRKGKERAVAASTDAGDKNEFALVKASVRVTIPPVFASDPRAGVEEMLDSMIMKHIPSLQGVVISHSNLQFLDQTAELLNDCPYMVSTVGFQATVWCPQIGSELVGSVSLFSPDHISLLCHRTFNVSIPRKHIPGGEYEFEHGPAENDPEYGAGSSNWDRQGENGSEPKVGRIEESVGRWIRRGTGEKAGGDNGAMKFTVIGLTLANQMISLVGSLQPDPFNPKYSEPDPSTKSAIGEAFAEVVAPTTGVVEDEQPKKKKRKKVTIVEDGEVAKKKKKKKDETV